MFLHVKRKFCSQRGASLSMALMLFLVCTVVASITLSAATAVAGRVSQLKEADASYYNVSSAARFVWDELKGEDGNGLVVEVTRTCDAQKDESGNWTGWVMKIDSVYDSSDEQKNTISSGSATLFQIATYDLIADSHTPGVQQQLDFSASRSLRQSEIAQQFDLNGSVPSPREVVFSDATYKPFKFKVDVDELKPVSVTVTKHEDQIFDFEFQQIVDDDPSAPVLDEQSYTCTLTVLVETAGGELLQPETGDLFENGITTVTWKPIDMTVGEPL